MLPENHAFLIRGDDGHEYGPVDLDELRDWVQENRAGLGTEVRIDEPNAPWHPWQNFPELVALLAEVHVTSPVPGLPGLVIAPMGRRIAAFFLDLIFIWFLFIPIFTTLVLAFLPDWFVQSVVASAQPPYTPPDLPYEGKVIAGLTFNLVLALYFCGFLVAHGQTPAKALLGLRVVDQTGQKPGLLTSFLRAIALIFSMYLFYIPFTYAFFNPQRRAFHDFFTGTYVVET